MRLRYPRVGPGWPVLRGPAREEGHDALGVLLQGQG